MKFLRTGNLRDVPFVVRTCGGAASQGLGLMAAIYISKNIKRPFQIRHDSLLTGGYYPLGIGSLLSENELFQEEFDNTFVHDFSGLTVGELLNPGELKSKYSIYNGIVAGLRQVGLIKYLNRVRMVWQFDGSFRRLNRTPYGVKVVIPGYFPFNDPEVLEDLKFRFKRAGLPSIFGDDEDGGRVSEPDVVIHVRLGDKRSAFTHPGLGEVHGIVDPASYVDILQREGLMSSEKIYVVSDDPEEAKRLLAEAGISAKLNEIQGDLWEDLALMARSKVVLCPWSTVSQFSAVCLNGTDTRFYYPAAPGDGIPLGWEWKQSNVDFYEATFLPRNHRLYVTPYKSLAASHSIYEKKRV